MIAFGPVPSRRLGMSLGINHVFTKCCSYACVYCQVGETNPMTIKRREFYPPERIYEEAISQIEKNKIEKAKIDYITLVTEGEPTLDIHLGELIRALKKTGIKIAVISNASMITSDEVKNELAQAHWVSLKVDSVTESIWKKINRPHGKLKLSDILKNIMRFKKEFKGRLVTETMLVSGMNTHDGELALIADYLGALQPREAFISAPIRPPVVNEIKFPEQEVILKAYRIFAEKGVNARLNSSLEDIGFGYKKGPMEDEIIDILAVHPLREEILHELIRDNGLQWSLIEDMVKEGRIKKSEYDNRVYYQKKEKRHD